MRQTFGEISHRFSSYNFQGKRLQKKITKNILDIFHSAPNPAFFFTAILGAEGPKSMSKIIFDTLRSSLREPGRGLFCLLGQARGIATMSCEIQEVKGRSLQCNSDWNFAVDFWVDFFLLFFQGTAKNPPRNPLDNSPGHLFGEIPLGFLQKPFLDKKFLWCSCTSGSVGGALQHTL